MNFCVRARSVNGRELQFGTFPDRIQASVVAALVNKMKEKGETVEAIKQQVYTNHGNKGKILRNTFPEHLKDSLKTKYASELQWVAAHTFLRSM
jgi:hypothetical protein